MNSPPPKPEVILTNFFAEPTVLLVPITSRDMLEIRMGRKTKISRVFGHSLGRHREIRQNKYLGRPIYTIAKSKHLRKEKLTQNQKNTENKL